MTFSAPCFAAFYEVLFDVISRIQLRDIKTPNFLIQRILFPFGAHLDKPFSFPEGLSLWLRDFAA